MQKRLVLLPVTIVWLLASAAWAQPGKKAPASKGEDKAAKVEAGKPAETDPAATAPAQGAAASAAADDLGEPPPKPATDRRVPTKLSPLTPAPSEFPSGVAQPPPFAYDKLLGDIATLRSRVAALTTTLFASKLRVVVEARGDDARLASFSVTLDGGVVFTAPERFTAEEERVVYEHAVAPGQHVVGLEIERFDARNKAFRTWQTSRFSVVVPENKLVHTHLIVSDDSDMGEDFPEDEDGAYDLRVKLRARVVQ
jgi:hypothetical protein